MAQPRASRHERTVKGAFLELQPVPASVVVVAERPREQDLLPVRLAVDDVLVLGAHRPEFQEREAHVLPEVVLALDQQVGLQADAVSVQGGRVIAPPLPDAGVPIRRADVGLTSPVA